MDKHLIAEINNAREVADSQLTKEELAERDVRHTAAHVDINTDFFTREAELSKKIVAQNLANSNAQKKRDATTNARVAAEQKARIEELYGKVNKPQEGYLDAAGTIPAPRNASITLQPRPDRYQPSDPRHTLSDADIIAMGMSLDGPAIKAEVPQPLTAAEQEAVANRMNAFLATHNN
jgi:chemotaxis response regulator CheB